MPVTMAEDEDLLELLVAVEELLARDAIEENAEDTDEVVADELGNTGTTDIDEAVIRDELPSEEAGKDEVGAALEGLASLAVTALTLET